MKTEPLMKFNYTQGADGMLYPEIQITETPQEPPGPYAKAWQAYMMEANPERISELLMTGKLAETIAAVDREAEQRQEELIQSLLVKSPMPQTEDTLERAAHMEMLTREANEIVRDEILHQPR